MPVLPDHGLETGFYRCVSTNLGRRHYWFDIAFPRIRVLAIDHQRQQAKRIFAIWRSFRGISDSMILELPFAGLPLAKWILLSKETP